MPDWISHEPVAWVSLGNVAVDLAIAFGAPITPEQKAAVIAGLGALSALFIRSQVTPQAKIDQVPIAKAALLQAEATK